MKEEIKSLILLYNEYVAAMKDCDNYLETIRKDKTKVDSTTPVFIMAGLKHARFTSACGLYLSRVARTFL